MATLTNGERVHSAAPYSALSTKLSPSASPSLQRRDSLFSPVGDVRRVASSSSFVEGNDYSRLPPDELFTRFSIGEVKSIYAKLKHEADSKQEELRLMVGERYRDLLHASTSIISISKSSVVVKGALEEVHIASRQEGTELFNNNSRARQKEASSSKVPESELAVLQSLSAHVKLLLDAPEQLWRLLEAQDYYHASWLLSLSRVTYRNLLQEQDSESIADAPWSRSGLSIPNQFPIVKQQWDTIDQFRSQIIHKATQSLRQVDRTSQQICETLMSILLLESVRLSDTVTIFLEQRTRALKAVLREMTTINGNSHRLNGSSLKSTLAVPQDRSPGPSRKSSQTSLNQQYRESRAERKKRIASRSSVIDEVQSVLTLITSTLTSLNDIFGSQATAGSGEALIHQALSSSQSPRKSSAQPHGGKSHAYKPSMASSFYATPNALAQAMQGVIDTHSVLEALPSAQLLLQYLPDSLLNYTPYVDTSSATLGAQRENLRQAAQTWLESSLLIFRESLERWLDTVSTVKDVWRVRSAILSFRSQMNPPEGQILQELADQVSLKRIRDVWRSSLKELNSRFSELLSQQVEKIRNDPEAAYRIREFDSASTSTSSSLRSYQLYLKDEYQVRPEVVGAIIEALDRSAQALQKDINILQRISSAPLFGDDLLHELRDEAERSSLSIAKSISDAVDSLNIDDSTDYCILLFIGRLSFELSKGASTYKLTIATSDGSSTFHDSVDAIIKRCIQLWKQRCRSRVESILVEAAYGGKGHSSSNEEGDEPSIVLTRILLILLESLHNFEISPQWLLDYRIPQDLLSMVLDSLNTAAHAGSAHDVELMRALIDLFDDAGSYDESSLPVKQLAAWQIFLGPLYAPNVNNGLFSTLQESISLITSQGPSATEVPSRSILDIAQPGTRFNLLLVGSTV